MTNADGGNGPGNGRDPAVFGPLEERIAQEEQQEQPKARTRQTLPYARGTVKGKSTRGKRGAREESEAFKAAKEIALNASSEISHRFGERLTREECQRLANVVRSAVVPKRKPGRRPKAQVTAAYIDWKAGMKPRSLCEKHIPGWAKHNHYRRKGEQKALLDAIRSRYRRERGSAPNSK